MPERTIVVVGGGVIGCAIAERLSRQRGQSVILCEQDTVGSHASGAAACLATGHNPIGILLAPVTAEKVARELAAL